MCNCWMCLRSEGKTPPTIIPRENVYDRDQNKIGERRYGSLFAGTDKPIPINADINGSDR